MHNISTSWCWLILSSWHDMWSIFVTAMCPWGGLLYYQSLKLYISLRSHYQFGICCLKSIILFYNYNTYLLSSFSIHWIFSSLLPFKICVILFLISFLMLSPFFFNLLLNILLVFSDIHLLSPITYILKRMKLFYLPLLLSRLLSYFSCIVYIHERIT